MLFNSHQEQPQLFDPDYYVAKYRDITHRSIAWEHFCRFGANEGRFPHPLFDTAHYLRGNPDVSLAGMNPFLHYLEFGGIEARNAHPLFDEKFYFQEHPEVKVTRTNPLIHFLKHGSSPGYNPNRWFDVGFYLSENPDVATAGVNPLVHYLESGVFEGRDPHPLFGTREYLEHNPDVARTAVNPLRHYLEHGEREGRAISRPLLFSNREKAPRSSSSASKSTHRGRLPDSDRPIPVFCVYGPSNVAFLKSVVIPAFSRQDVSFPLELHFLNYRSQEALMGNSSPSHRPLIQIRDWSDGRPEGHFGFGESMNYLFGAVKPPECFVYVNPDSFPMPNCLARLVRCFIQENPAIVEASQWPSAHPKEFDAVTHETPWASGAFGLISSPAFEELNGFDPTFFLYLEDVDLSWRAWLKGYRVLHEPTALCGHATGLHSYQPGRFYYEHFFSLRNFIVISYKFFGESGERSAVEHLKRALLPEPLHQKILESYKALRQSVAIQQPIGQNTDKIKILGLNLFHELRG